MGRKNFFKKSEHKCRCGCGLWNMSQSHMYMLNQARELAMVSFVVTSGSRCIQHNKDVGGAEDSSHLIGEASDISTPDPFYRFVILRAALVVGFRRIGIGEDFLHVSNRGDKPQKIAWLYWPV